jgi:glycosyltransferase involved in cell wall biosynthesis
MHTPSPPVGGCSATRGATQRNRNAVRPVRPKVAGKFLRCGSEKFYVKGFSYGPFAPNGDGEPLPERDQVRRDFAHIAELGANTIRIYFPPPEWLLDEALRQGLFVFIDVPWEKHRCFFEDWEAMERARDRVRQTARELGNHPAVMAISVVNEFPVDVVRFQGPHRVERFIEELLAIAKDEAPDCLVTFVNFPTTEFLKVRGGDFACFNVYIHDEAKFGEYLDRLQHIAGNKPLILGEYGIDSVRESDAGQSEILTRHLTRVFRHGLAGSVVFAYTDDWFTGGHQITDWFFGVTRADRSEKPSASVLKSIWNQLPDVIHEGAELPRVSVVVCSYNGAKTLWECLDSLVKLDYPDYEVILVNDGSTDRTARIAEEFPEVRHYRQANRGLSVARNVGARLASGEIVAYTDDDCVVDEHWLHYLVRAMLDQQVEGIGGPNITPDFDSWVAKCVAASPGNPSHVMLDDRHAEHVPGCNMAFRRSVLLGMGGFDPQYRVAGDDVDVCWRLLDAGLSIGYAAGAMVWHYRRATINAYGKQQKGYGRSEAMVRFKHPQRFGACGRSHWHGIIYGDGAVGLPLLPDRIYHGEFGGSLFQTIYRHNLYGRGWVVMCLEWHFVALFLLMLATLFWPLAAISAAMWSATLGVAVGLAGRAPLPRKAPRWCRPLVGYLYLMQPIWRGWFRLTYFLRHKRFVQLDEVRHQAEVKRISSSVLDLYWDNKTGKGRYDLLPHMVAKAKASRWSGDFGNAWASWDVKLVGDAWHDLTIHIATEELGWPRRFTRARCSAQRTLFNKVATGGVAVWFLAAVITGQIWGIALGLAMCLLLWLCIPRSRDACLKAATRLIASASIDGGFSVPKPAAATTGAKDATDSHPAPRGLELAALQPPLAPGGMPAPMAGKLAFATRNTDLQSS